MANATVTMGTTSDVAGCGGFAKNREGGKVWSVKQIRNNKGMNELAQGDGNEIKGENEMKMLAWLSGGTVTSGADIISWSDDILSYEKSLQIVSL